MGIDGIGKPPGAGGPGGIGGGPLGPGGTGKTFEVSPGAAAKPAAGSDALQRLESGEMSLEAYLDTRVSDAVSHLDGKLPADQLEFVRQTLRQQLETDPVLVQLVRRATSAVKTE
jgi:hypothetical protein